MKTKRTFSIGHYALFLASFCFASSMLMSCDSTNNESEPTPKEVAVEKVNPGFEEFLSKQKQVVVPLSTYILPNGKNAQEFYYYIYKRNGARVAENMATSGPQEKKNYLISLMLKKGNELSDKKNNVFNDVTPKQTGIAYSLGAKDYRIAQAPTGGTCNLDKKFHGLDCSGFVYEMAAAAGLNLGNRNALNAEALSKPEIWQKAIQSQGKEYQKIRVEDISDEIGNKDSKLESGDIIYFYDKAGRVVHHIGVVAKSSNGQIYFLNSYGNPEKNCDTHFSKGPSSLPIAAQSWFDNGYNYGVLRVITDISGNWDVYIRCKGQTYDAIKYNVTFTSSKNDDNVTAEGSGIDYDGVTPVNVKFKGQYIKKDNLLKGKLSFTFPTKPSGNREDSFEIRLNYDDTGYFDALKVLDNGGCYIQIKLINLEK